MTSDLLTTTEAARLAGVGASSVKRWADQNLIRYVKTAGGHRRILREDFERFLREQGGTLGRSMSPEEWVDRFLESGVFEVQGELLRARERLGAWHRVSEELGHALAELGDRWMRGDISVLEEHVASERLARALSRVVESMPASVDAPRALLAMAEGDDHTLGLSLVEVCLRECAWNTIWSGRGTPLEDLQAIVASGSIQMLALSASVASQDPDARVQHVQRRLRARGPRRVAGAPRRGALRS
jgi:MerR family transcriptional regulator, light-induced transcriptional regulator